MANRDRPDDHELIENMEDAPSQSGASGGNLQRKIGARDEETIAAGEDEGVSRVRDRDKADGANLPRFNES